MLGVTETISVEPLSITAVALTPSKALLMPVKQASLTYNNYWSVLPF